MNWISTKKHPGCNKIIHFCSDFTSFQNLSFEGLQQKIAGLFVSIIVNLTLLSIDFFPNLQGWSYLDFSQILTPNIGG
jgi:hypothetical protein